MCHPDDLHKYEGCYALTTLFNKKVPIVADEKVAKDKGTGLVMCCTFGDETDIEWWNKHNLDTKIILNKYGKLDADLLDIADEYKQQLAGLKVSKAREVVIELLQANNLLNEQKPITHAVKCAERSGAELEFIPTHQWFVKILDQKQELHNKVNECNWYPDYMRIRAEQWIDGLKWDWCISRQRYFGVPFPIWYSKRKGEEGKILVADAEQMPVNPLVDLPKGYTADEVEPELDVMDTWATSSVSPQLSSKGINNELAIDAQRHKELFPADLRPQAHEIIRTWAFYTIAKAHLHEDTIPWHNLMISGWCLAEDKTKMSKSKGNVVTPVGLIQEKSADIVRYWASTSRLGADTAYSEDVMKIGKKLINKLWNSSKFAAQFLGELPEGAEPKITESFDKWVLGKLKQTIQQATEQFEKFEYCEARIAVEDFFWNDFCDNYLEIIKSRAYGNDVTEEQKLSAIYTLQICLDNILRLFTPFTPHICDELHDIIFESSNSINSIGTWPKTDVLQYDDTINNNGDICIKILDEVRKTKAAAEVSIKHPVDNIIVNCDVDLSEYLDDLKTVTTANNIILKQGEFAVTTELAPVKNDAA